MKNDKLHFFHHSIVVAVSGSYWNMGKWFLLKINIKTDLKPSYLLLQSASPWTLEGNKIQVTITQRH